MTLPKITITIEQAIGRVVVVNWRAVIGTAAYEETMSASYAPHIHAAKTKADLRIIECDIIRGAVDAAVTGAVTTLTKAIADAALVRHPATVEIRPNTGDFEDYTHSCDEHLAKMLGYATRTTKPHHYEVRPLGDGDRVDGEMPGCCWR